MKTTEKNHQLHTAVNVTAYRRFIAEVHRRQEESCEPVSQKEVLEELMMMLPPHPSETRRKRPAPEVVLAKLAKGA